MTNPVRSHVRVESKKAKLIETVGCWLPGLGWGAGRCWSQGAHSSLREEYVLETESTVWCLQSPTPYGTLES